METRQRALSAWAFEQSYKRKTSYYQEVIDTVQFFQKQAEYIRPETVEFLRMIEAGAVVYDHDDVYPHIFTCIDSTDRVMLRDSGRILLFAIDCSLEMLMGEIAQDSIRVSLSAQTAPHDRLGKVPDDHFVQSKLSLEFA